MAECPRCRSDKVVLLEGAYPEAFECRKCGLVFTKTPQALTDEGVE